jgi:hypothetical protein
MKPRQRATLLALSILVSTSACSVFARHGGSSPTYNITTNREIYSRGNTGEATIRNISGRALDFNLCPRRLERQANKYWVVAFEWPVAGGACTTELRKLAKDDEVTTLFDIPTGVPIGTYRLVFTGLRDDKGRNIAGDDAATKSFTVR